ncbi:hypothetical protein [Isoptericola haloaureus]|uniref:Uncharacterized protein n=1 Tax=Isoptericola haloaureus TaxID=1542902 RepID=A0ABU7Z862_9MICO
MTNKTGGYVLVGTRDKPYTTHPYSHVWRFWASKTSFYIKPRNPELGKIKVSLHGPDDRPGIGPPIFKYGFDSSVSDRTGVLHDKEFDKRVYPGEEVAQDAHRVLRIRIPWDTLRPGDPPGSGKLKLSPEMDGLIARPPRIGYASDLDVYVSDGEPYWPVPAEQITEAKAAIGPYRNDAGQFMTIAAFERRIFETPTPRDATAIPPMNRSDTLRGVYFGNPGDGLFPWVVETFISRKALSDPTNYRRPKPISLAPLQPRPGFYSGHD